MKSIFLIVSLFLIVNNSVYSQAIELVTANSVIGRDNLQILSGNVVLRQGSAMLYCNLAHLNMSKNSLSAWGNVRVESPTENGKSKITSDTLIFDDQSGFAKFRGKVRLENKDMILITNTLDYNMNDNIGRYYNGGRTVYGKDTLISDFGDLNQKKNLLYFRKNVRIENSDFLMLADSLKHYTDKKTTIFLGPTKMINQTDYIYCEGGWYNHNTDMAQFTKNAYMRSSDLTITSDSLYYDKKGGFGQAVNNVKIIDTVQNITLTGGFARFFSKSKTSFITKRAMMIQASKNDTMFLHADTLRTIEDSVLQKKVYTKYRLIKAYYHVKLFKQDIQAKCDSLSYSSLDSMIKMYREPILWSNENQLTAEFIQIRTKNNKVDLIEMQKSAFIATQIDSVRFNQIKGDNMIGYVKNNQIVRVDVKENCETVYFLKEQEELIGVNRVTSKKIRIELDSNKVRRVWFFSKNKGATYPPFEFKPSELILKGFKWIPEFRPLRKEDIFEWKYNRPMTKKQ